MSVDDTDEWDSKEINQICDETKAFENKLKCRSNDDKESNAKSKLSEISCHEEDLSQYASANYKDYYTDPPNKFDEKWAECELNSISSCKISDEFNENVVIPRIISDQGNFTSAQNVKSELNLKENVKIKEVIEISEVVTDPIEKNYISASRTKSLEEEAMLIDHYEVLIQDIETDVENVDEMGKKLKVPISNENMEGSSKSFSGSSNGKRGNSNFLSFRDPQNENKDRKNDYSVILYNAAIRNFVEELHLRSDDAVSSEHFGDKNSDFDPMQDTFELKSEASEIISGSFQEYLKGIDEKIESAGLRKSSSVNSRNVCSDIKRSNSLSGLYYEWFKENYIKEETEYRWGSDDGFIGKEYLPMNRSRNVINEFKSYSFGENPNENENRALTIYESKKDLNDQNALDEDFVCGRRSTNDVNTKGKFEMVLEQSAENVNGIFTVKCSEWLDDIAVEKISEINQCSDYTNIRYINKCNKSVIVEENPDRRTLKYKSNQEKDEFSEVVLEVDGEEFEIRHRIGNFVISTYRDMCSIWETLFVRSFEDVFADTYEFLLFIFFISVCFVYFLHEKIQLVISNYKFRKVEKSSSNIYDKNKERMILDTERPMSPITAPEVMTVYEATSSEDENATDSLSTEN